MLSPATSLKPRWFVAAVAFVGGCSGSPGAGPDGGADGGPGASPAASSGTPASSDDGGAGGVGSGSSTSGAPSSGTGGASGASAGSGGVADSGAGGASDAAAAEAGPPGACQPATCGSHKWACWPMPNSVSSGLAHAASYSDLGNGAVLDNVTCLVWQKTENVPTATSLGVAMPGTMTDNQGYCAALATAKYAGFDDWRLPTRVEIASLLDLNVKPGTGDALAPIFGKETTGYYRTSSLWYETIANIKGSTYGWIYNMGSGLTSNAYLQTSNANARCVRGNGNGEGLMEQAVEPPNHYTIAAGEVTDNYTGLVWQQVFSTSAMAWSAAAGYCSGLSLNGHAWRVPSLNELSTLVNEATVSPAIVKTAFPNVVSCGSTTWFWSREQLSGNTTYDWGINFCDGYTGENNTTSTTAWNYFTQGYVRCVR